MGILTVLPKGQTLTLTCWTKRSGSHSPLELIPNMFYWTLSWLIRFFHISVFLNFVHCCAVLLEQEGLLGVWNCPKSRGWAQVLFNSNTLFLSSSESHVYSDWLRKLHTVHLSICWPCSVIFMNHGVLLPFCTCGSCSRERRRPLVFPEMDSRLPDVESVNIS